MNPDPKDSKASPGSGAAASTTPTTVPPAELFLLAELLRSRADLRRTRMVGLLAVIIIGGYMGFLSSRLRQELNPKNAAEHAVNFVVGQVGDKSEALATEVKVRIPALVAELPDHFKQELPKYREALEARLESDFQAHCAATAPQLGKHLDDFLQAHIVTIAALLKTADNKPEMLKVLGSDIANEVLTYIEDKGSADESLKQKIDTTLAELRKVEKLVERLANAKDLTPQEKKTRHAIAIVSRSANEQVHQLQEELKAAIKKAN